MHMPHRTIYNSTRQGGGCDAHIGTNTRRICNRLSILVLAAVIIVFGLIGATLHRVAQPGRITVVDSTGRNLPSFYAGLPSIHLQGGLFNESLDLTVRRRPCAQGASKLRSFWTRLMPTVQAQTALPDCLGHYMRCAGAQEYNCNGCGGSCFMISDPTGLTSYGSGYTTSTSGGCCLDSGCANN